MIRTLPIARFTQRDLNDKLAYLQTVQLGDWPGSIGDAVITYSSRTANTVWAGPASGNVAVPTWRALVAADIPNLDAGKITTGLLALARGGTNADLSATGGAGQYVRQTGAGAALTVGTIIAADVPVLDASKITTGQLAVARGGTGADLSGTGAANNIVKQTSLGGALTVAALAAGDVPDLALTSNVALLNRDPQTFAGATLLTKTITKYNNISTVRNGVPAEYASATATASVVTDTGTTTLYTAPTPAAFMYRVEAILAPNVIGTAGSTVSLTLSWNDGTGTHSSVVTTVLTGALTDFASATVPCVIAAGQSFTYRATATLNGGAKYSFWIILEAL